MIKKLILRNIYFPKLCKKIDINKYSWGWKSKIEIDKIKDYKLLKNEVNIDNYEMKYIHEYRLKEYCEEIYKKTYNYYIEGFDFLESDLFSLNLGNGLNYLRSKSNINNLDNKIKIENVDLLNTWIKYGKINNISKFCGIYNNKEIIHELCAGIIGPEIQNIWDQQSIKQKVRLLIKLDYREDILEFERDLLYDKENWQLCNINRIII